MDEVKRRGRKTSTTVVTEDNMDGWKDDGERVKMIGSNLEEWRTDWRKGELIGGRGN